MALAEVIFVLIVVLAIYIAFRVRQNYIMYQRGYTPIREDEKAGLSKHMITQSKDSIELIIAKSPEDTRGK